MIAAIMWGETVEEFVSLLDLPENWNSYGAKRITRTAVETAAQIAGVLKCNVPQVVPTPAGGVQLEWHIGGVDFEIVIGPDGEVE